MTGLRCNWAALLDTAIVASAAACLIVYGLSAALGQTIWTRASPAYQARLPLARPLGYLSDGRLLAGDMHVTGCELIRFTAQQCLYCRLEDPAAALMAQQARSLGCEAINITPYLSVDPGRGPAAIPTLAFVTMDWIQNRLNLIKEPTTMIVNSGGEVVWYHVGEMNDSDVHAGLAGIRRLAPRLDARNLHPLTGGLEPERGWQP